MLLAATTARTQQVAGLSTLTALPKKILTRVVGKLKVDEEYSAHVNLDLEKKYDVPLHQIFSRTGHIDKRLAGDAMVMPCYKENLPFLGATSGQMEASRLSNGVTTVSVDNSSPVVHLGVYLGVGTGNETRANAGSLQVMKNAWLGSTTRRTLIGGHREPLQCGANIEFNVGRDITSITASCPRDKASLVLDHMTQNLVCPEFFNHELHQAKVDALHQTGVALSDPATIVMEEANRLAYRGTGLGRSIYLKAGNTGAIERNTLLDFAAENFKDSNNIAVVGVGLDPENLSGLADEYLWSLEGGSATVANTTWTGMQESQIEASGNGALAMCLVEGAAAGSQDALVLGILKHLAGAGGSAITHGGSHSQLISAAAPYTQSPFNTQCVNINNVNTGMFGLSISAAGQEIGDVLKSSYGVMIGLNDGVSDQALETAKNKLKLELLSAYESNLAVRAATGLESIAAGSPSSASQLCGAIDSITNEEVIEAAKKINSSAPILVSYGNVESMPLQRELQ
ncbi:cytochrome b-c1 complex subunit 2, mitochondrial-like [Bolinopsis microptera]|uniref:cytochrome b-c1 complex subunit 2, mitochondrial-like n=1 Tax=Bolinopsis microptera TaxID=2820187 RepID=UPI003078BE8C